MLTLPPLLFSNATIKNMRAVGNQPLKLGPYLTSSYDCLLSRALRWASCSRALGCYTCNERKCIAPQSSLTSFFFFVLSHLIPFMPMWLEVHTLHRTVPRERLELSSLQFLLSSTKDVTIGILVHLNIGFHLTLIVCGKM